MNSTLYFWDGTSGVEVVFDPTVRGIVDSVLVGNVQRPCVDIAFTTARNRYGFFNETGGWESLPLEEFPKAFRVWMLIKDIQ